jgi:hypothetical protein
MSQPAYSICNTIVFSTKQRIWYLENRACTLYRLLYTVVYMFSTKQTLRLKIYKYYLPTKY